MLRLQVTNNRFSGRTPRLARGPTASTMVADVSPPTNKLLASGTDGYDLDGAAIVQREVILTGCTSAPPVPKSFTVSRGTSTIQLLSPKLPRLAALGLDDSYAVRLSATFDCAEPWEDWLSLSLIAALRHPNVGVSAERYERLNPEALHWYGLDIPAYFFLPGRSVGFLNGADPEDHEPTIAPFEPLRLRIIHPEEIVCTARVGTLPDGRPLEYSRSLAAQRYLIDRTDRAVLIGRIDLHGAREFRTELPISQDTSCADELRPKVVRTRARALAAGVPASLLDDAAPELDWSKQDLVVFASPTRLEALRGGLLLEVKLPREFECPGGLPPDVEGSRSSASLHFAAPRPQAPAMVVPLWDPTVAYLIAKGDAVHIEQVISDPEPCSPAP
jgi:hypothetical protein